jgi:hypothetical protein
VLIVCQLISNCKISKRLLLLLLLQGPVRNQLASDTVQVLDMMVASSQAEVERMEYSSGLHYDQEAAAQPDVHIEELSGAH